MPPRPRIKAADAVREIRAGMTDSQLRKKYGLSPKGLRSLLEKLIEVKAITRAEIEQRTAAYEAARTVHPIDGSDMISDIRGGMSDSALMEKYGLPPEGLAFALQTLMDSKVISPQDLYGDTVCVEDPHESPRKYLMVALDIYESEHPENRGEVSEISESGLGILGIEAKAGQRKTFVIPTEGPLDATRITFEAQCSQAGRDKDSGEWSADFHITKISKSSLEHLQALIKSLPSLD